MGEDGKPTMYIAIRADITERKRAEAQLAEREEIYRSIVTLASDGISLIDPDTGRFIEFNDALSEGLGYSREEFAQLHLADIQGDLDEAAVAASLRDVVAVWQASFDTLHRHKNGALRNVHINRRLITIGTRSYILSVVTDNTERIMAHQAEVDARDFLQSIVAQVPGCLYQFQLNADGSSSMPFASEGLRALHGVGPEEVASDASKLMATIDPQDLESVMNSIRLSARDLSPWRHEYRVNLEGEVRWLARNATPQRAEAGAIIWHGFISDITEHKRVEAELTQYRQHLEELVAQKTSAAKASAESAQLALKALEQQKFVLDQHAIVTMCGVDGLITYGNDKFTEISGYTREEFMGQDHKVVNSGYHPKGFFKEMYEVIGRGEVWHAEVCNRAKDGSLYWVDSTVVAFMGEDGKPREYIAVRTDITERKQIEKLAKLAEEAAHAANRSKSEFLANMSHEIRTPMNGVIGMVDILQQTPLLPEQARMLDTIHNSSLTLLSILNDILDFSKIEAGKLEVEHIPTHLREVTEGVAQLMLNVAGSKEAQISLFVDPTLPIWVLSDPTRLRQILFNLLGNALKFIPKVVGRAMLHVHPMVRPDGVACVQFSIIDNGIGMSEEVVAKLFQPFTQADASTARKFGGTGLGLSITQRLVEMMHGRITVTSTPGVGSEFVVEFPLQEVPAPAGRTLAPALDLSGIDVLAVSPETACATTFQLYLGAAGARVTVVPDLATARGQLALMPAGTVLVLDLQEETGPLPRQEWPTDVPVVRMVSRSASAESAAPLLRHETRVLARPLLHHDLLHGVAVASGRMSATDPAQATASHAQAARTAPSVQEAVQSGRLILIAEDNETNRDVMQEQLRLLGYACEVAQDGAQALQLWQSAQEKGGKRYALLLTDCHMPNLDGFELTEAIRAAEPAGTRLPIIAITANAMQGEAQRCRERGMDDYLSKPLRLGELGAMLARWMPQASAPDRLELPLVQPDLPPVRPELVEGVEAAFAVWNPDTLTELVGDNTAMHQRLLGRFLTNTEQQVAAITAGAAVGDTKIVTGQAHTLKSAARSVGALALGELCEALETAGHQGDAPACAALAVGLPGAFAAAADRIKQYLAS
jgi:PAS domain S-box-containing protein